MTSQGEHMDPQRQPFDDLLAGALSGRLTRRQVFVRAAALGLSVPAIETLLSACGGAAATPTPAGGGASTAAAGGTPKKGGVLKVGLQADPTSLDPHKQSLTALFHVTEHVYGTLVRINKDLLPEPDLAEKWDVSSDGKTYTFTLRKGVKFHNGRGFAASDVKYSYERILAKETASPNAALLAPVDKVDAPNDTTVVVTLKAADASFLTNLTSPASAVVPKEEVDKNGDLTKVAVGTGPFKFKQYTPNTSITLERNPDYWESGKPYLDGIEMTPISDDTARTAAVKTGTVDFIEYAPWKDIPSLKTDTSLALAGDQNTNIRFIAINVNKKPFDNVKVRQAIAAAVDRDAVLGPAVFGFGTPTAVLFPPGFWATLDVKPGKPDLAKAKQLLSEAGVPDGFKTVIQTWSAYSFLSNAALVVQEQLKQIGITADINAQENAAYIKDYLDHNFDLSVTGTSAYVDPNDVYLRNFGSGQKSNASGYSNPQADKLIADGVATTDREQRKKIYQQLQQLLLDDAPWVNLYIANQFEAMKSYVRGYTHIPTGSNIALRETWLNK
jgi:peptide/nickel transport system substrate-binding protein